MNNEKKKLSQNRKKRNKQKVKMDDKMKSIIKKSKSEKKKKMKKNVKIEQLKIELIRIKYGDNTTKLQSELKEFKKTHVVNKNLHEIKNEILVDYAGEFENVGELSIGDHIRQTHLRSRNINDYESYIKAIDQDYESEDAISNGYIYKVNTLPLNLVIISQYGKGCDFKHEIIEYRRNICFIPTKGYCFVKCNIYLSG